jgi:hypothetical protein
MEMNACMHTSLNTSHIAVGPRLFGTCNTTLSWIQHVSFFVLAGRMKQLLLKNLISRLLAAYKIPWLASVLLIFKPVARQFVLVVREQPDAQPKSTYGPSRNLRRLATKEVKATAAVSMREETTFSSRR